MEFDNHGFVDNELSGRPRKHSQPENNPPKTSELDIQSLANRDQILQQTLPDTIEPEKPKRDAWGNEMEFLMSCIAMSVGLGNVWRFPFTALENGGGAFLIPYLIVLFIVGRPIYYLEMCVGQFSSRGSAKVYDMVPAMRGVGFGQVISITIISTYYVALMALTLHYFFNSFKNPLPWSACNPEWGPECNTLSANSSDIIVNGNVTLNFTGSKKSAAEMYFLLEVLKEYDSIDNGIGMPSWPLTACLAFSWLIVLLTLIKGVQTSGKASYFLALFPYVVMGILLVRAVTLPGAGNGIFYFINPQWDKILNPSVWYAAVTQCFFSLTVGFGNIIMYASFNKFDHNIYRDVTIVSLLDTFTSLLAGCTIFGILGHLAYIIDTPDIGSVVKGGTGLAFISYPDAISKFQWMPQIFAVLFFFMLFVLGIGSNIAMTSCIMTVIRDQFPKVKHWHAACGIAVFGLGFGTVYLTPGGQFILNLVDFFGASFISFILAIAELIAFCWIYGVDRLCRDVEFMIGRKPGIYWRLCWGIVTPLLMIVILIYTIISYEPLTYKNKYYPESGYAAGWIIASMGIIQLPIWAIVAIVKQKGNTLSEKIRGAFRPTADWGPSDPVIFEQYQKNLVNVQNNEKFLKTGIIHRMKRNIFG